ncbi:drug/metabolite transporter (DMT)-like permease [Paenibacillus sp. DS2015]|uniref:DMT family transporter n=1 Tax=Paenibacillus sp. DS2015 TaxID=3373917 RepID=UPI003D22505C
MKGATKAYIAMSVAMTTVGSSIVVGKWVTQVFPVFLASLLRFGLASMLLILILILKEGLPKLGKREFLLLLIQALTGVFLFNICLLFGLKRTPAIESGIITSTTPMAISLLSWFFFKEKMSLRSWIGVVMAVVGVATIQWLDTTSVSVEGRGLVWIGYALLCSAVISEALFTLIGKSLSGKLSPLAITTYVTTWGFSLFLPMGIYQAASYDFGRPSFTDWLCIVYLAVVVTVIGFVLWYYGISVVSTATSASFTGMIAVSSLLLSNILLHEPMGWNHLGGMGIVIAAIFFTAQSEKYSKQPITQEYDKWTI